MIQKVKRGIARLIDAYEDGLLTKAEFEPRLRNAKQRLDKLEVEIKAAADQTVSEHELRLVIGQFEDFSQRVREGLREGDWMTQREIIRALVKRIEIGTECVRVVYKVAPAPFASAPGSGGFLQDCWRRERATLRRPFAAWADHAALHHPRLQIAADQFQDAFVLDTASQASHQHVMVHAIEELLQVHVDHPAVAGRDVLLRSIQCLVGTAPRTEAEA